jgi:hypothetical protein
MFGAPGERQYGKRDAKTEVTLPATQGAARMLVDLGGFIAALLLGFLLGRWAIWAALAAFILMKGRGVLDWVIKRSDSAYLNAALLLLQEEWVRAIICLLLLPLVFNVAAYRWDYDFSNIQTAVREDGESRNLGRHYLTILRKQTWEYLEFNEETGLYEERTKTADDNVPYRFPLLLRAFLICIPVAYYLSAPLLRRRFADEVRQAVPAMAANYVEAGFDTEHWGQPQPEAPIADVAVLRVEHIENHGARGNRITAIEELPYRDEIIAAFVALNGGRIPHLSRRNLHEIGIGDEVARNIMTVLEEAGYIEYPGGNRNQASALTEKGVDLAASIGSGID